MSSFGKTTFGKIGIIGGTGLDNPDILTDRKEIEVDTPFGKPSDVLVCGKLNNIECVLLARHGRKHTISPTNVNYRANVWALRDAGCTHIIVSAACGSLREDIKPGEFIILDSFIDRTTKRMLTYYDGTPETPMKGILHMPMDKPFCQVTRGILIETAKEVGVPCHQTGTIVVIEGPRYSSKAESKMFQSWGGDVIGMTSIPEVVLAKELGLCYATIAMATDYDCWKEHADECVSVSGVMETFQKNVVNVQKMFQAAVVKVANYAKWDGVITDLHESVKSNIML